MNRTASGLYMMIGAARANIKTDVTNLDDFLDETRGNV